MTILTACCAGCCRRAQRDGPGDDEENNAEQQQGDSEVIWFQSTISVKGLTETSSQPVDVEGFM